MQKRIACQGAEGAYSGIVSRQTFPDGEIIYFKTFSAVCDSVTSGFTDYGVLPVENSIFGPVKESLAAVSESDVKVVDMPELSIRHRLLALPGAKLSDIREILSHKQALGQCSIFLDSLPDDVKRTVCKNTAVAARHVAESGRMDIAAIGSEYAGKFYGLMPICSGDNEDQPLFIQNEADNRTKFYVIAPAS